MLKRLLYFLPLILLCACRNVEVENAVVVPLASLPEELSCATAFTADNAVFVFGGRQTDDRYSNKLYKYLPKVDEWQLIGTTPLRARVYPVAVALQEKVYIGLGYSGDGIYNENSYLRDFWQYDAAENQWTRLADFPDSRSNEATAFFSDGYIYVGLGFRGGFTNLFYRYDPSSDSWTDSEDAVTYERRCTGAVGATAGGRTFVGTGFRKGSHKDWYEYLPADAKWSKRTSLPGKGRHNAAVAATDNMIYLFGGWHYGDSLTGGFYFDDMLRYDVQRIQM